MSKLQDYKPDYYDGVLEMNVLLDSEQVAFDQVDNDVRRLLFNKFVMKADSDGLSIFEYELGMDTDLSKSLETRRYDILVRMLPPHPITFKYLKDLIKSFDIPAEVARDVIAETITTASQWDDISMDQIHRLQYLLNVYLPANMTYSVTTHSETRVQWHLTLGVATTMSVETCVYPKLDYGTTTTETLRIGSSGWLDVETTVNAKKEGM